MTTPPIPESRDQAAYRELLGIADDRVFVWPRYVPYFYCGYFRWAQHTAYLRQMEEVIDRFLAWVGLPIGGLYEDRRWIPVVQEHAVDIAEPAAMEEMLYTTFRVTEIVAHRLFRGDVSFYVVRDGAARRIASGQITHGYVEVRQPEWDSRLVRLDPRTEAMLQRSVPEPVSAAVTHRASVA